MPIINLQKRSRELGRIRLGQKGDKGQPQKLDRFRFTSNSRPLLEKIAELYGGEVREWVGGTQKFEVISTSDRVPIMVPPQPVSQWHEAWRRSGIAHRCDGERDQVTDELCDPEDPLHIEAIAKPVTRLNVVLRDVEGIGVWRTESKGWHAATELPDVAEFLAAAGGYVNGWLALDYREDHGVDQGKPYTHKYLVPIIEIDVTPAQLMAGHGRVAAPALAGGPVGETPALAAAGPDYVALAAELTTADEIRDLYRQAAAAGHLTQGLADHFTKRAVELGAAAGAAAGAATAGGQGGEEPVDVGGSSPTPAAEPDADGVVDAEIVHDDADAVWERIVATAGRLEWSTTKLHEDFKQRMGLLTDEASAGELEAYLGLIAAEVAA